MWITSGEISSKAFSAERCRHQWSQTWNWLSQTAWKWGAGVQSGLQMCINCSNTLTIGCVWYQQDEELLWVGITKANATLISNSHRRLWSKPSQINPKKDALKKHWGKWGILISPELFSCFYINDTALNTVMSYSESSIWISGWEFIPKLFLN